MTPLLRWLSGVGAFLDAHNGAVTAVATLSIGAFTVALAWVGWRQARLTRDAINLSRDEFIAEHRPWIAVRRMDLSGPISVIDAGFFIPVEFTIENTGTVPATDFLMYVEVVSTQRTADVASILEGLIDTYRSNKSNPYLKRLQADVIFPNDRITHPVVLGGDHAASKVSRENPHMLLFSPVIVGAFFYRSPLDKTNRHTTFVYTLAASRVWLRMDEEEEWPDLQPDEVRLSKWHFGWTAT